MMEAPIKKRIFIAIDLPGELKHYLYGRVAGFKDSNLKTVKETNIHLTMKFIGYVDERQIDQIRQSMRKTAYRKSFFLFRISDHLSCFPKAGKARVLFVGIEEGTQELAGLFALLEEELDKILIEKEKKAYVPHITLARAKEPCNMKPWAENIRLDFTEEVPCRRLSLYESLLQKSGPKYQIIDEVDLKNLK